MSSSSPGPSETSSDVDKFVQRQIDTIDRLLLDAYGTVYKLAVKNIVFEQRAVELSESDEMITAKTLICNLWSVLDYCCVILYCENNKVIPTPEDARKQALKFPCAFSKELEMEPHAWEEKKLKKMIGNGIDYKDIFSPVQNYAGNDTDTIKTFYWLHFLRNTLTHNNILITNTSRCELKIWEGHTITPKVTITIGVPLEPWSDASCNRPEDYEQLPLIDILFDSCKVVTERRDKILSLHSKFEDKFNFKFVTTPSLTVEISQLIPESKTTTLSTLTHLECYGVLVDLKKDYDTENE